MDLVEDYAGNMGKYENEDVDTLSEWIKAVKRLNQILIEKKNQNVSINTHAT